MVQLFLADKPEFQSTLPARGATRTIKKSCKNIWISIHAPRTGSDQIFIVRIHHMSISIHAPRTGSDNQPHLTWFFAFISIHAPRTGSDLNFANAILNRVISIHAPRTGSDEPALALRKLQCNFNPRSPHGERRGRCRYHSFRHTHFNPRSPHGERRKLHLRHALILAISIHAPRTGSDGNSLLRRSSFRYFNPRSPHGERRVCRKAP